MANYKELQQELETRHAHNIFTGLLGVEPRHKKIVRLFDTTRHSAEVYYETGKKGKPSIYNFSTGETYFAISAYMRAHNVDYKTAVQELAQQYYLLPFEKNFAPRVWSPREQPTEKEQKGFCTIANPIFGTWHKENLAYWQTYGISQQWLEQYNILPLQSFDLVNFQTGKTTKTINPKLAYAYSHQKSLKKYEPLSAHKWQWIGQKATNEIVWCLDELQQHSQQPHQLFVMEGKKDALALTAHFANEGIYAVGLDTASQGISTKTLQHLQTLCPRITLCLDNDTTGKDQNHLKSLIYRLPYLPYPEGTKAKDFAELIKVGTPKSQILDWLKSTPKTEYEQEQPKQEADKKFYSIFAPKPMSEVVKSGMQKEPLKMLFGEFIKTNEFVILFGDNGTGKSLLTVQIANNVALGKPTLGLPNEEVPQKVLYFDFELTDRNFAKRYGNRETGEMFDFSPNFLRCEVDLQKFAQAPEDIDYTDLLIDSIKQEIIDHQANMIIIDNIVGISLKDLGKSENALPLLQKLDNLKKEFGITLLVLSHPTKQIDFTPISKTHLSGSKKLTDLADAVFALGKCAHDSKLRYLKDLKNRNGEAIHHQNNVLVVEYYAEDSFMGFREIGTDRERNLLLDAEQMHEERERAELITAIEDLRVAGKTQQEISQKLGISQSQISKLLAKHKPTK